MNITVTTFVPKVDYKKPDSSSLYASFSIHYFSCLSWIGWTIVMLHFFKELRRFLVDILDILASIRILPCIYYFIQIPKPVNLNFVWYLAWRPWVTWFFWLTNFLKFVLLKLYFNSVLCINGVLALALHFPSLYFFLADSWKFPLLNSHQKFQAIWRKFCKATNV